MNVKWKEMKSERFWQE